MSLFQKIKKTFLVVSIIIGVLTIVLFTCASFIAKYLIEKYDEEYTGRQIIMDWAYVNLFTGYVHFENIEICELKSKSIFFSSNGISTNFNIHKLFSNTYELEELTLNRPKGNIIQNKKVFNFDDLITKFSPKPSDSLKPPVHFNILNIKIIGGEFHYTDQLIPVHYFIKKVNFESSGMYWNVDTINALFSFEPGLGKGHIKGNSTINSKNSNFRFSAQANKFDLEFIQQYLKDFTDYGHFTANLDADIKAKGNFKDAQNIDIKGYLAMNDFHFGKNAQEDYASFDKLVLEIIELNPKNKKYIFDSVMVSHPYFKYEKYDYLDNIQTMFGKGGANVKAVNNDPQKFNLIIEIADYVKKLSVNFFNSDYKINRLAVYNGDIRYIDYSLTEKFSIGMNPLNFMADSISKNNKRVNATFKGDIQPYGKVDVAISMNPKDNNDFDVYFKLQKLPTALFNPYLLTYTSYPMDKGTMEFTANWNVRNGIIQSTNHLLVIDPRLAKKIKEKDAQWVPMPLIMAFVRDPGNVIDYEIPIKGNLKDPNFILWDVITDLIENIFIKPPTIPYRTYVKNVEQEIEESHALQWAMRQGELNYQQGKYLSKLADFLKDNPNALLHITPTLYLEKEKEYILFFEAKKKYYLATHGKRHCSEKDSITICKLSVKDSSFVRYLNQFKSNASLVTVQEKCANFIDKDLLLKKLNDLEKQRKQAFLGYFEDNGTIRQLKFQANESIIPYNGFSYFKIKYKGEIPQDLILAYQDLNELDQDESRKKYKSIRQKINNLLKGNK